VLLFLLLQHRNQRYIYLEESNEAFSQFLIFIQAGIQTSFNINVIVSLFFLLILIFCSALISGSEVAFFSLKRTDIDNMRKSDSKRNKIIFSLLQKPKKLLASILISNNFINIAIVILSTYIINQIFDFGDYKILAFVIEVLIVTSIILLMGEIMPKVYATKKAKSFASFMAPSLKIANRFLSPISFILVSSTSFIDKRIEKRGHDISKEELSEAIDITTDKNVKTEEKQMLKGIVRLSDTEVSEIMRSRVDVTAVNKNVKFHKLLEIIKEGGFSRIPVFDDNFDKVIGLIYIKDLLPYLSENNYFKWNEILRPVFFIPENKKINDLLSEFKEKKIHLAIVVDEFGGTSGIVTMEDILEEIVGEINDEFDSEEGDIEYQKINENEFLFDGKVSINDVCKIIKEENNAFDEIKGEADSLAGLLLELKSGFPVYNEEIKHKMFTFKVMQLDKRRIKKIKLIINKQKR
jgi:magnesium and cobalt exporter, CNNM family